MRLAGMMPRTSVETYTLDSSCRFSSRRVSTEIRTNTTTSVLVDAPTSKNFHQTITIQCCSQRSISSVDPFSFRVITCMSKSQQRRVPAWYATMALGLFQLSQCDCIKIACRKKIVEARILSLLLDNDAHFCSQLPC